MRGTLITPLLPSTAKENHEGNPHHSPLTLDGKKNHEGNPHHSPSHLIPCTGKWPQQPPAGSKGCQWGAHVGAIRTSRSELAPCSATRGALARNAGAFPSLVSAKRCIYVHLARNAGAFPSLVPGKRASLVSGKRSCTSQPWHMSHEKEPRTPAVTPVSYTHQTLPTICSV